MYVGKRMKRNNGRVKSVRYEGTLLVYAPPLRWYQFGVPYSSELVGVLDPAINREEDAIVVAPDESTRFFLKMESLPSHVPIIVGEKQARREVESRQRL